MNITLAAADIARRIPEMARDSAVNNEGLIQRILSEHQCNAQRMAREELFELVKAAQAYQPMVMS